jgi:hypothetical protein
VSNKARSGGQVTKETRREGKLGERGQIHSHKSLLVFSLRIFASASDLVQQLVRYFYPYLSPCSIVSMTKFKLLRSPFFLAVCFFLELATICTQVFLVPWSFSCTPCFSKSCRFLKPWVFDLSADRSFPCPLHALILQTLFTLARSRSPSLARRPHLPAALARPHSPSLALASPRLLFQSPSARF